MKHIPPIDLCYDYLDSPVGPLLVAGDDTHLHVISFPTGKTTVKPFENWVKRPGFFPETSKQLNAYFAGELTVFDLPIIFSGSDFQNSVWNSLLEIPFGETCSYGDIARKLNNPGASRAVGLANGTNPIPIVVPCHRVIGSDNSLTGFGGGVETKRYLLEHEGAAGFQASLF